MLVWKAPSTGTYTINGQYVTGDQPANGASLAIVDSRGATLLSRTSLSNNSVGSFSYTKSYNVGDVVQFQVGSDFKTGNTVGLKVDVEPMEDITNWNAVRDFYLTPSVGGWTGRASPTATGSAWNYYTANVNYYGSFPSQIGTYFSQNLTPCTNNTVLWDPTGGFGFARYALTTEGTTSSLGVFDSPWFEAAPGYSTEARGGIWMQAAVPGYNGAGEIRDGIVPVITWTAPRSGIYDFQGSFQVAINGSVDSGAALAIADSTGGIPLPRISAAEGSDYSFGFRKSLNQGDVIQFQVGSDFKVGAAVALNADVTRVGDLGQKVPSAVKLNGSSTLAYNGTGVIPALTVLGASNTPTYSYKGVDGTSYGPSSSAPTARGRYEVTVSTAGNTNWSAVTNKFYYSVGTFNAFKDFWWGRTNGQAAWTNPSNALAQGRSQGTPTAKNAWGYGLIDCTTNQITDPGMNLKFQALGGYAYNSGNSSWTYHNGDPAGTRISLVAANSNNTSLVLSPSAGSAGKDGRAAALRWTAPAAGTYVFKGSFVSQASNSMSVAVQTYGDPNLVDDTTFLARSTVAAGATLNFDFTNTVVANQTVTWVAGSDGASDGDAMLLSANVTQEIASTPSGPTFETTYVSGTENNPGPNGLQNLMNYALGGTGPNSRPILPVLTSDGNNLTLTANVRDSSQGVAVIGQVAESLAGPWTDVNLTATGASSVVTNTTVKAFSALVETNKPRKFLRLKATKQ